MKLNECSKMEVVFHVYRDGFPLFLPIRAKTREKDTYFEAGIVQSLEK